MPGPGSANASSIGVRAGRPTTNALLTVILADGINLGLTHGGNLPGRKPASAHLHDWHISEAAYGEALGRLIDAHRAMPLAALWGDGTTLVERRTAISCRGRGAAIGDINARSGNEPGVAFYTHVSDRYGPFATRVIAATAGEAPYVLDGLLYQQTGLTIEEHYTDTGIGPCVRPHALLRLPFRAACATSRNVVCTCFPARKQAPFAGMTGEPIALGHVAAHWDELLRFASIRTGTVTASAMLRRLSAYPRQNGLALALRELAASNALFMLDWLRDIDLRRRTQAGLNKRSPRAPARALLQPARRTARSAVREPDLSRLRPQPARRRHHLVEHPLSRNGAGGHRHARRNRAPHRAIGLGAYLADR
jgi:TnpA family transposase